MNNDLDNNLLCFSYSQREKKRRKKGLTGRRIMMSKTVKHPRIYGPIKEQKRWGQGERVCVCVQGGDMQQARPQLSAD